MPVNTRNTLQSTKQFYQELPHKNIRINHQHKTKNIKKYQQQHEPLQRANRKEILIKRQTQIITLEQLHQEQPKQIEVKIENIAQIYKPPPRQSKRGRHPIHPIPSNINQRSTHTIAQTTQIGSNPIEIKIDSDNLSSTDTNPKSLPAFGSLSKNQSTSPSPQTRQAQNMAQIQKRLMEESIKRKQLEDAMQNLAKLDGQQTRVINGPFLVLQQYRPVIESKTQMDYRELLKIHERLGENVLRQKINYSITRDRDLRKQSEADSFEQKNMLQSYRQMEDYLFFKCKQFNEEQLLEYKRSLQYKEIQKKLIQLHPYHVYKYFKTKKRLSIENNILNHKLSSKVHKKDTSSQISIYRPHRISEKTSINSQAQNEKNSDVIEIKIQSQYQTLQSQIRTPSSLKINMPNSTKASSPHDRGFGEQFYRKTEIRKRYEGTLQSSVEPVNQVLSQATKKINQNVKESSNPDEYDRDKILQIIQTMNKRTNLDDESITEQKNIRSPIEKNVSQVVRSRTASVKSQAITGSIKPPTVQQLSLTNSQVLSTFELNQPKFEGLQRIEIITRQSVDKTEQTTKHERLSNNSRNQGKSSTKYYNNSNQNWQPFNRNPKVKQRLQILNRFHYNPFEIENGDDQCDLWRRLMTEEIDDLKSHYKYEEPNEYFINENQKYDKGYVLPLKVREEDFFIANRYDPSNRGFKQEIQTVYEGLTQREEINQNEQNNQTQQRRVKREIIDFDDSFAYVSEVGIENIHVQTTKENNVIQQKPIIYKQQQQVRLEESGRSFNYDLLEGFQIPDLTQENEPTKIIEYDYT